MGSNTKPYLEGVLTGLITSHTHPAGTSSGDMTKAVYDSNEDGFIDEAQLNLNFATHSNATDHASGSDNQDLSGKSDVAHIHVSTDITGTAVLTADGRLSDARTPLSHVHVSTDITGTAVLTADARLSDARTPASHDNTKHTATYITTSGVTYEVLDSNGDVGTASAQLAVGNHTHPGGSEAFPVGAVFIAVVSTNPATLLGYGTWSAIAAGRMLVGLDSGDTDFDTVEETGGAKTKTIAQANLPNISTGAGTSHNHTQDAHSHITQRYPTTTGSLTGYTADTSMNGTPADNTLPTKAATATNQPESSHTHSLGGSGTALNVINPYFVVYMWKRTI